MGDRPRLPVLSLLVLLVVAGGFGLILGLRAIPPGETEIINAVAADYVAETGGDPAHCFARPSASEAIRMVVTCTAPGAEPWQRAVDTHGAAVYVAPSTQAEAPQT